MQIVEALSDAVAETEAAAKPVSEPVGVAKAPRRRMPRKLAIGLLAVADIAAVFAAFILPAIIYSQAGGIVADWRLLIQSAMAATLIVHLVLRLNGMYAPERLHDVPLRPGLLFATLALTMCCLLGHGVPVALRGDHEWVWFVVGLSSGYTLLLFNRAVANPLFAHLTRKGVFDERIAVFGAGNIARRVKEHLEAVPNGVYFAGVFDDRMGTDRINTVGVDVTGKLDALIAAARNNEIDKIVIALPQSADQRISSVARTLESLPVSLHVVTHISSDLIEEGPAHTVSSIGSVGLIDVKKKAH